MDEAHRQTLLKNKEKYNKFGIRKYMQTEETPTAPDTKEANG